MHRGTGTRRLRASVRERGAAAVLAMMFLVIFASLATAMAVVSHGNLRTADSHLRMNRAMAAADAGTRYTMYLLETLIKDNPGIFRIAEGEVDASTAVVKWGELRDLLHAELQGYGIDVLPTPPGATGIRFGPVPLTPGAQTQFIVSLVQHPIPMSNLSDAWETHPLRGHTYIDEHGKPTPFYNRAPYDAATPGAFEADLRVKTGITQPIQSAVLDERYIRLVVQGIDGPTMDVTGDGLDDSPAPTAVTRTLSMDLRLVKKLNAAIISRSRIMLGRNVMVDGNIGSSFMDVHLENGHPIQMESDFRGLTDDLDALLDSLAADLGGVDQDGDNRLSLANEVPAESREAMAELDANADGYIDDFDLFFNEFDGADGTAPDGRIGVGELQSGGVSSARATQLVNLIDGFHPDYDPAGTPESEKKAGVIDFGDRYAKVRGTASFKTSIEAWENGAAEGNYHDHFEGPIDPKRGEDPSRFGVEGLFVEEDSDNDGQPDPFQRNFGVEDYRNLATGDLAAQATAQVGQDPDGDGNAAKQGQTPTNKPEAVPYKSDYPYDHYDRPIYENMTFTDLFIPKGTNALFKGCTFRGVTYVETYPDNKVEHPTEANTNAYNYSGMQEADGSPKHPDLDRQLSLPGGVPSTKKLGNNIRFDGCRFLGPIVSGSNSGARGEQPSAFSQTRNKLTFTSESGPTEFPDVDELRKQGQIDDEEWDLYRRGRIITPHMSVEIGSFDNPDEDNINLSGTVVAGVLDLRGQVKLNGSIITTYEPKADDGTVMGDTSPQFNTTIGYFGRDDGDLEAEAPDPNGSWGNIQLRYDPSLPLPNGIVMTIQIEKLNSTYYEGAK